MVSVEQVVNSNGVARFKLHVNNTDASDLYKIFMTTRFTSVPTSLNVRTAARGIVVYMKANSFLIPD